MEDMDPSIHPNLSATVYKNMTAADRPPVPDKDLQFILIYDEHCAILGGSNMTDRYWSGTVWYYDDISNFDREKAFLATKTENGVCDGAFLEENKFVIGEDGGALVVMGLAPSVNFDILELQNLGYACQHDDSLLTLSVFSDRSHIATGGSDCCLKVWDIAELIATHSYGTAHTEIITCVDTQPKSDAIFASTSLDGEALVWDIRESKPAKSISKNNVGITAVAWNSVTEHIVAIGARDGSITLIDIRNTVSPLQQDDSMFPRGVHKLLFNPTPEKAGQLAACCDDVVVRVVDINKNLSLVYENNSHTDFVRGISWHNDNLYTCSWDNSVQKHITDLPDDE